jgi:hypothetical protein
MAEEVVRTLTMTMHEEGAVLSAHERDSFFAACERETARALQEAIIIAQMHGMKHDAAAEVALAAQFAGAIRCAMFSESSPQSLLPPLAATVPAGKTP